MLIGEHDQVDDGLQRRRVHGFAFHRYFHAFVSGNANEAAVASETTEVTWGSSETKPIAEPREEIAVDMTMASRRQPAPEVRDRAGAKVTQPLSSDVCHSTASNPRVGVGEPDAQARRSSSPAPARSEPMIGRSNSGSNDDRSQRR